MKAKVGDRLVVHGSHVDDAWRDGEVLEDEDDRSTPGRSLDVFAIGVEQVAALLLGRQFDGRRNVRIHPPQFRHQPRHL